MGTIGRSAFATVLSSIEKSEIEEITVDENQPANKYYPSYQQLKKTTFLIFYFVFGCVFYYHIEGWDAQTSLSFTVATMTTVGKFLVTIKLSLL
jgi:hypothetical protein